MDSKKAALYILDGGPLSPLFPQSVMEVSDFISDYMKQIEQKIRASDNCKHTRLKINDEETNIYSSFLSKENFLETTSVIVKSFIDKCTALNASIEGFDLFVFMAGDAEKPSVCIAYLPYKTSAIHFISNEHEKIQTNLVQHRFILPHISSQMFYGAIINLQTYEIDINDIKISTSEGSMNLFSDIFIKCESALSQKEIIKTVEVLAQEVQPSLNEDTGKRRIKQALSSSIEATGSIDIEVIAEQLFGNNQENFDAFTKEAENRGVEQQIPIQSKKVKNSLDKIKIVTDNGVSILLPQRIANDSESFIIVNNPDGSISITIRNIMKMKTQ